MELRALETIVLTAINAFGIFLILIVLANSFGEKMYRWFALMTFALLAWVDSSYIGYFETNTAIATAAYRLNLAFVILFFFSAYVFYIECFLKIEKKAFKWGLLIVSLILASLSLFTNTINDGVIVQDWGNEIRFGVLDPLFYIFSGGMAAVFIYYFVSRYVTLPVIEKRKVLYFLVGTFLLIVFNVAFNIISPLVLGTGKYQHLGDYSAVIFLAFTTFAMVRRKFLNVKIALTAFLISVIGILIIVDILALSDNLAEQGVKLVILAFFVGISVVLVRSVLTEIRQKEEIALKNKLLEVANKELAESKAIIQSKAEEQKDIIDIMGHEIRTPLTVIIHELDLHETITYPKRADYEKKIGKEDTDLIMDSFQSMSIATSQAVAVVNDMLETARLDKQKFDLNYSDFDLVEAVKTCIELSKKVTALSPVNYRAELPDKLEITADKVRVKEAVDALLSNAVKYGRSDGTGEVDINVEVKSDNNYVDITVSDKGIGISQEDIYKLGKKFVRLDPNTENFVRPGGTGLGLFVVNGIAEKHGGKLVIASNGVGKGSSFTIRLPLTQKTTQA